MTMLPSAPSTHLPLHRCWELLRAAEVGRVAVVVEGRPEIFPVNHLVDGGSVVFRTAPGTKLAGAAQGAAVAFEVDGLDAESDEAWSVVVHGRAREMRSFDEIIETAELPVSPWHEGVKPRFVRIEPDAVSGRRFARAR